MIDENKILGGGGDSVGNVETNVDEDIKKEGDETNKKIPEQLGTDLKNANENLRTMERVFEMEVEKFSEEKKDLHAIIKSLVAFGLWTGGSAVKEYGLDTGSVTIYNIGGLIKVAGMGLGGLTAGQYIIDTLKMRKKMKKNNNK